MKKIIIISIVVLGIATYFFIKKNGKDEKITYKDEIVSEGTVNEYVDTTGQVQPLNRVEILPPSSGRIEKIFVEEGYQVKNGDVLALMSSQDRVAILDAARAISEQEYKYWEDSYKPIKIISPLNGRIILRNIVEGQTVGSGTVLFAISDTLIVVADVDESDIGKISNGQLAYITLDAYPDKKLTGRVFQILDEGKNSSNVIIYKVKIKLDSVPSFLKSQMSTNIKIQTAKNKKAIMIPSKAINYSKDGKTYVIIGFDKKNEPLTKDIEIGSENENRTEVKSGLEVGDKIYYQVKEYKAQKLADSTNPFMPKRPQGQAKEAMRRAR